MGLLGLITLTVFESWSAVYTQSFSEIGCAQGGEGACMSSQSADWFNRIIPSVFFLHICELSSIWRFESKTGTILLN